MSWQVCSAKVPYRQAGDHAVWNQIRNQRPTVAATHTGYLCEENQPIAYCCARPTDSGGLRSWFGPVRKAPSGSVPVHVLLIGAATCASTSRVVLGRWARCGTFKTLCHHTAEPHATIMALGGCYQTIDLRCRRRRRRPFSLTRRIQCLASSSVRLSAAAAVRIFAIFSTWHLSPPHDADNRECVTT